MYFSVGVCATKIIGGAGAVPPLSAGAALWLPEVVPDDGCLFGGEAARRVSVACGFEGFHQARRVPQLSAEILHRHLYRIVFEILHRQGCLADIAAHDSFYYCD